MRNHFRKKIIHAAVIALAFLLASKAMARENYTRTIICQFDPKDIDSSDLETLYFDYDVDENENLFYKDRKNGVVKVFDKKGKIIRTFSVDRDACLDCIDSKIFTRNGNVLIYTGSEGYLSDAFGKNGKHIDFKDYVRNLNFVDGVVFDLKKGRVLFDAGGSSDRKKTKNFNDDYKYGRNHFMEIETIDGKKKTDPTYDGYHFWGVQTLDQDGNIFCNYGAATYPDPQNPNPKTAIYKFKLIKFNKDLEVLYTWDGEGYKVNEKNSNVYRLEIYQDHILQLVVWRKSN